MAEIDVQRRGPAAILTIDRADRNNRLSTVALVELADELRRADQEPAVRCVIVTGRGERFCVGGQIDGLSEGDVDAQAEFGRAFTGLHRSLDDLGKPVVAAVNGDCSAAGMSLLAACDIAVAAEEATFSFPEVEADLFPMLAMAVTAPALPRKVAFDLYYSGRAISASAALALHLVNEVVPGEQLENAVDRWVELLSAKPARALKIGRRAYHAMEGLRREDALRYGEGALVALLGGDVDRHSDWS